MTIADTANRVQYTGNGVTSTFSTGSIIFYANTDLIVTETVISTNADTLLVLGTNYTVTGGNGAAGSITLTAGALASTKRITIERAVPYTQTDDYVEGENVLANTIETAFDKAVIRDQQLRDVMNRSFKMSATSSYAGSYNMPEPQAGRYLAWNSSANALENKTLPVIPVPINTLSTDVRAFGAVGDGTTDDTAAIQAACDSAGSTGMVYIPDGTYKITSSIVFSCPIQLDGRIDMSGCGNGAYGLACYGSNGTFYNLTANATVGATTATISSANLIASGIAAGDWVLIKSETIFDPGRTDMKIAELVQVDSVNTGTGVITFVSAICDTYNTANTAQLAKVTMKSNPIVYGRGEVFSDNTASKRHHGIRFFYCDNAVIHGIKFRKMTAVGFQFWHCVRSRAINIAGSDFNTETTGYLASVGGASRDVIINALHGTDCRHLFTTNNSNTSDSYGTLQGIPRRVVLDGFGIINSDISQTTLGGGDAVDTHAAAEDIHIWNGTIFDASGQGVNFECRSGTIKNVQVYGAVGNGIRVHNETGRAGEVEVDNCYVENITAGSSTGTGIIIDTGASTAGYISVKATNLKAYNCAASAVTIQGASGTTFKNVVLSNIQADLCLGGGLTVNTVNEFTLNNIQITGVPTGTYSITIDDCLYGNVDNAMIRLADSAAGGGGIRIRSDSANSCTDIRVSGVKVRSVTPSGGTGLFIDDNAARVVSTADNDFSECTTPIRVGTGTGHKIYAHRRSLTSAGTTSADATVLYGSQFAVVTAVGSGQGIRLPVALDFPVTVFNRDASDALLVYPPTGSKIDGLSTDAGYSLAAGSARTFTNISTTQAYSY